MALKIVGMSDLVKDLEKLSELEKRQVYRTSLEEAGDILLKDQQKAAPKAKKKSKSQYKHLKVYPIKSKKGNVSIQVGIGPDNWVLTQGLYFHHYGFRSHPADNWMDKAFDMSEEEVFNKIRNNIEEEISKK